MFTLKLSTPTTSRDKITTIKIKSSKSEIRVHRNDNGGIKVSPELLSRGHDHTKPNEDFNRITQAWERVQNNALSKAIAIAPQVGCCSFSPTDRSSITPEPEPINDNCECVNKSKHKMTSPVTSTPLKSNKSNCKSHNCSTEKVEIYKTEESTIDVSEIRPNRVVEQSVSTHLKDDIDELEAIRVKLLNKIETNLIKSVLRKSEEYSKKFIDNDERIKEKLAERKIELDRERIIRTQEHYYDAQKSIIEAKENALKFQELQQSKFDHDKRVAETNERIRQNELKRKELEEKHKHKREELKRCVDGIYEVQISYRKKYNQITEITKKCKDIKKLNEKVSDDIPKLKGLNEVILKLVEKCKEGKVTLQDLNSAQGLLQQLNIISEQFAKHTDDINKATEAAEEEKKREKLENESKVRNEEMENLKKAAEQKKWDVHESKKDDKTTFSLSAEVEDCISEQCLKWHLQLGYYLSEYEKKLEPLLNDASLKKFRLECQKVVNVPVNAISPLDDLHLQDKLYKLGRMLRGEPVPVGNTMFLPTGHPLGISYCTNLLAKKFVKQGEHTVSSKPEAAFAIAAVIVALWVDFPEFGQLLLAHFHRECPYLIPAFMPQLEGQSNMDYYRTLGYQYSEEGKVEPQDQFLRRMSGVARLYAAILVTPLRCTLVGSAHPHGLREAWRWLAATLNLRPRPDISATLLFDVLEVTGHTMFRTYGLQFTKLIHVLCADYFPIIDQVTPDGCGGPVVRLKSFLEKFLKEGQIPPPSGRLPPNFW